MVTINIVDKGGCDRYIQERDYACLGRQYDNISEAITVHFPDTETDSTCTMIITDINGYPLDHITIENGVAVDVKNNISQYSSVIIGFCFTKVNGYVKNSEPQIYTFAEAVKPEDFAPVEPTIKTTLDYLVANGFVKVIRGDNSLDFYNSSNKLVYSVKVDVGNGISNLKFVDELPTENIDEHTMYFLAKTNPTDNDYYDEYIYHNGWELIGADETRFYTKEEIDTALETLKSEIISKINTNVVKSIDIRTASDNVYIDILLENLSTGVETTLSEPINLASDTVAGLMSIADYKQIRENKSKIEQLSENAIRLLYTTSSSPTASDIEAFVISRGYTPSPNISVVVQATNHIWKYYTDTGYSDVGVDTVNQFTNGIAGIIKGADIDGKVYAETDGTGSIKGWAQVKSDISNLQSDVQNKTNVTVNGEHIDEFNADTKLDKVSGSGNAYKIYGTDGNGNNIRWNLTYFPQAGGGTIPAFNSNRTITVDPAYNFSALKDSDAINKKYVDDTISAATSITILSESDA